MITAKQYTDTYNLWRAQLRDGADKIIRSSEVRKYLIQNSDSAPLEDLLIEAVKCIADLTGDTVFQKEVLNNIERRKNESN